MVSEEKEGGEEGGGGGGGVDTFVGFIFSSWIFDSYFLIWKKSLPEYRKKSFENKT